MASAEILYSCCHLGLNFGIDHAPGGNPEKMVNGDWTILCRNCSRTNSRIHECKFILFTNCYTNTPTISTLIIIRNMLVSKLGIDTHELKGICNGGERDQRDPDGRKKSHEDWRAVRTWEISRLKGCDYQVECGCESEAAFTNREDLSFMYL